MISIPERMSAGVNLHNVMEVNQKGKVTPTVSLTTANRINTECTYRDSAPVRQPAQQPPRNFQHSIVKGQKVNIGDSSVSNVRATIGFNVKDPRCDVNVSTFMLNQTNKVLGDEWFVFYGSPTSPDNSVRYSQSNGHEIVDIDLNRVNPNCSKIVFVITIHEALQNNLNFGMLSGAYITITSNNKELVSFTITDYYVNVCSMMIGELYRYKGVWKFNAIGDGIAKDLAGLCQFYGVDIE